MQGGQRASREGAVLVLGHGRGGDVGQAGAQSGNRVGQGQRQGGVAGRGNGGGPRGRPARDAPPRLQRSGAAKDAPRALPLRPA